MRHVSEERRVRTVSVWKQNMLFQRPCCFSFVLAGTPVRTWMISRRSVSVLCWQVLTLPRCEKMRTKNSRICEWSVGVDNMANGPDFVFPFLCSFGVLILEIHTRTSGGLWRTALVFSIGLITTLYYSLLNPWTDYLACSFFVHIVTKWNVN